MYQGALAVVRTIASILVSGRTGTALLGLVAARSGVTGVVRVALAARSSIGVTLARTVPVALSSARRRKGRHNQ